MRESVLGDRQLPSVLEPEGAGEAGLEALLAWLAGNRAALTERLQRHGAVLLRGFEVATPAAFNRIAETLAAPLVTYAGGDSPRGRVLGKVYNSTNAAAPLEIFPHNEKSYSLAYPRLVLFYCDRPAATGGETPLVDGRRILARLAPEIVAAFRDRRVTYIQNLRDGNRPLAAADEPLAAALGKTWQETFEEEAPTRVERLLRALGAEFRWRPDGTLFMAETVDAVIRHPETGDEVFFCQADQWHASHLPAATREALLARREETALYHACRFGDGSPIPEAMLDAVRRAIRAETLAFPWRAGDVVLVDNILTLHGRSPYTGERRVLVAMGRATEPRTAAAA